MLPVPVLPVRKLPLAEQLYPIGMNRRFSQLTIPGADAGLVSAKLHRVAFHAFGQASRLSLIGSEQAADRVGEHHASRHAHCRPRCSCEETATRPLVHGRRSVNRPFRCGDIRAPDSRHRS